VHFQALFTPFSHIFCKITFTSVKTKNKSSKFAKKMAKHNDLGKAGENAAAAYLEKEDYLIRHRNWRKGHFELDIVAAKDNELVVVEVKTRSNTEFTQPEDAVDVPKIRRTVRAADTYIKLFQIDIPVRFDIITVVGENGNFEIEHIKEAFLPPLF
jgi:putative endonuclease